MSLAGDVAVTHRVLDGLDGPAVLVGHSYGGAVITEAGNHENVAALVYIAAFAPTRASPSAPSSPTVLPVHCAPARTSRSISNLTESRWPDRDTPVRSE
jgi:pimeloyl-ACP methyl ester carboxylesterase